MGNKAEDNAGTGFPAIVRWVRKLKSEKGGLLAAPVIVSGLIAMSFYLAKCAGSAPFFSDMFLGFGVNLASGFFQRKTVTREELREVLAEEIKKMLDSESALRESGYTREELNQLLVQVEETAAKTEEQLVEEIKRFEGEFGEEFGELEALIKDQHGQLTTGIDELKSMLEKALGKLDKIDETTAQTDRTVQQVLDHMMHIVDQRTVLEKKRMHTSGPLPPIDKIYGRSDLADELAQSINNGKTHILWIYGMGGIGKSTVANMIFSDLASEPLSSPFGRFIWHDLKQQSEPEIALNEILSFLSDSFATSQNTDQNLFDKQIGLLSSELSNEPALFVLDNLDSAMQPAGAPGEFLDERWPKLMEAVLGNRSTIIVTSRPLPTTFSPTGCEFRHISGLNEQDSLSLMKEGGLRDDDDRLKEVHRVLQGHPMAISALIAAVRCRPGWEGLIANAGEILDAIRSHKDLNRNPVLLFERIISPEQVPEQQHAIVTAMPVLFRPETAQAIAALRPEIQPSKISEHLDELANRQLVEVDIDAHPPLYHLHSLVEQVASERTEDSAGLHKRIYDYYLCLPWDYKACNLSDILHLIEAANHAFAIKNLELCSAVLYGDINLDKKLRDLGRDDISIPLHRKELELANEKNDLNAQVQALTWLSHNLLWTGDFSETLAKCENAERIAIKIGDRRSQGILMGRKATVYWFSRNIGIAYPLLQHALEIAVEVGDRYHEAVWIGRIGEIFRVVGKSDEAFQCFDRALAIAEDIGDKHTEGAMYGRKAQAYIQSGDYDMALKLANIALEITKDSCNKHNEAVFLSVIGESYEFLGQYDMAANKYAEALDIAEKIGDKHHKHVYRRKLDRLITQTKGSPSSP